MTPKEFYGWQTGGGTDDVMRVVAALESSDIQWCAIGGIAVNHWSGEPVVTRDVDLVVATESIEETVKLLEQNGFRSERFAWSINFKGNSEVSIQLSTEEDYQQFPSRSVPADVHGILMRVASLEDTLEGKVRAWKDVSRRQSRKFKDLGDIARLVETHPYLWAKLSDDLRKVIEEPENTEENGNER